MTFETRQLLFKFENDYFWLMFELKNGKISDDELLEKMQTIKKQNEDFFHIAYLKNLYDHHLDV